MAILSGGKMPSSDLLAKAGISDADARTIMGIYGGGGSSSGGGRSSRGSSSKKSTSTASSSGSNVWADFAREANRRASGAAGLISGIFSGNAAQSYTGLNKLKKDTEANLSAAKKMSSLFKKK